MWEDYRQRRKITRLILLGVCVLLALALFIGVRYVSHQATIEEEENYAASQQSQAEAAAAKAQLLEQLEADYQQDLATIQKYIPGIVCWGDTITTGTVSGVSYASALEDLIEENITDLYDFRETLDYADRVSRVEWEDYTVEIPVINMGGGDESTGTILGRNGAAPYILSEELTVPADCTEVRIKFTDSTGNSVNPLSVGDGGVNNVTIGGIEGTLSLDSASYRSGHLYYYFTRLKPGRETVLEVGTEIITAASDMYREDVAVIFIGTYGGYSDVDTLISQIRAVIDHQTTNKDRYIVMSPYYYSDSYYGGDTSTFDKYETALSQAFGEHYVNIRKYLISDALDDAGLKATTADTTQIKNGRVPDSLRSSTNSIELSATAYRLIGRVIYDRMDQLGYFDEVKTELGLDKLPKTTEAK